MKVQKINPTLIAFSYEANNNGTNIDDIANEIIKLGGYVEPYNTDSISIHLYGQQYIVKLDSTLVINPSSVGTVVSTRTFLNNYKPIEDNYESALGQKHSNIYEVIEQLENRYQHMTSSFNDIKRQLSEIAKKVNLYSDAEDTSNDSMTSDVTPETEYQNPDDTEKNSKGRKTSSKK